MQIEIPLLGSLANIIGMFLGSLISGIAGAVVMNLIDKFIAKKQERDAQAAAIEKGNQILAKQQQLQIVNDALFERDKENAQSDIVDRHKAAESVMKESLSNVMEDIAYDPSEKEDGKEDVVLDDEDVAAIKRQGTSLDDLADLLK